MNKVETPTNNRNYKKFKSLGYVFNIGDVISVNVEHLSLNSRSTIRVSCDICNKEKDIKYCDYIKNIKKHNIYACSVKCGNVKYKKTNLEKFGCEYPLQSESIKNKLKKYFDKKYDGHPSKLKIFEDKKQKTNLERYGVKQQMELKKNVDKIKITKLERYGDENYNNHELSKLTKLERYDDQYYNNHELSKLTKLERYDDQYYNNIDKYKLNFKSKYGVDNPFKLEEVKEKIKKHNLKKWGTEYYQSTDDFKNKFKETCLDKYGVEHPFQVEEIFKKQQISGFKCKEYNNIFYRGSYELDFIKYCEYNKIDIEKPNRIEYIMSDNKHYYFPDFYLPKYNLIIEVKSSYYFELNESKNFLKKEETINKGYNFIFLIDKDYTELEKIIKNK